MKKAAMAIDTPEDLVEWLTEYGAGFRLSISEAALLLGYVEGSGCQLMVNKETMYRADLHHAENEIIYIRASIDDVVGRVCDWNFGMLQHAGDDLSHASNDKNYLEKEREYEKLVKDEAILDGIFDRTCEGRRITEFAEQLAGEAIAQLINGGGPKEVADIVHKGVETWKEKVR